MKIKYDISESLSLRLCYGIQARNGHIRPEEVTDSSGYCRKQQCLPTLGKESFHVRVIRPGWFVVSETLSFWGRSFLSSIYDFIIYDFI